jgi:hypothetical protein
MKNLLLPWHEGFWEFYHCLPPINWLKKSDEGTVYLAPDPVTGSLNFISCPEEYYDRETETQSWIEQSMIDPDADPFVNWYPFKEFDEVNESNSLELII